MGDWLAKYDGTCARCGASLLSGTPAVWDRSTKTMHCIACPDPVVESSPVDLDHGIGGRSARAEYERRAAKRSMAITERWGKGFKAKVMRALTTEPQTTRAWAIGAVGEEQLARELASVPGLQVLNDRRVHGTKGNIDHIVIAPAGVFVVDAKNHKGMVEIRNRGSFLHADHRLTVGRRDCSAMADKMAWQVEAVTDALQGVHPMPPVQPVLCFLAAEWPLFGAPEAFRGVRLEGLRSLKRLVAKQQLLDASQIDSITALLAAALPAK